MSVERLIHEVKETLNGCEVVVALSGGMDSSLALHLVSKALPKDKIKAVTLDYGIYTYDISKVSAKMVADDTGVKHFFINAKEIFESVHKRGQACNRCVRTKLAIIRERFPGSIIVTGANLTDSWSRIGVKRFKDIYAPLLNLSKSEIKGFAEELGVRYYRIGEGVLREGCKVKHLWKPLVVPNYHGVAVCLTNDLLLSFLRDRNIQFDFANVKIIGPLSKNIALVNVSPSLPKEAKEALRKELLSIKEIDEVIFLEGKYILRVKANPSIYLVDSSKRDLEQGKFKKEISCEINVDWLLSGNRRLLTFHVVDALKEV
ncbi:MAG: 7-cyano-7-deazaguanine synthase [Synergistetes bacterium]|nr:7-cyano-7-deazaguanine synthase [Synergistota bacterium]MCX8128240.1 7-cyano-7-deazaguanine synthase [Synergistota bacterium]MDW8192687.1 7-cyano-7-deazaguanine synthase [Synergistota bacterium]